MSKENYFSEEFLNNHAGLVTLMRDAVKKLVEDNTKGQVLLNKNGHYIKGIDFPEMNIGFSFAKHKNKTVIFYNDYSQKKRQKRSVASACGLDFFCQNHSDIGRIHQPFVMVYFDGLPENDIHNELPIKKQGLIVTINTAKILRDNFGKEYLGRMSSFSEIDLDNISEFNFISMDWSPLSIVKFFAFLEKEGVSRNLTKEEVESLRKLSVVSLTDYEKEMPSLLKAWDEITNTCVTRKFTRKNAYRYNDSDNATWLEKGILMMSDQNFMFMCDKKDDDNFIVYGYEKNFTRDFIVKRWKKEMAEGTISEDKIMMKKENGKFVSSHMYGFSSWVLDMECSQDSMEEEFAEMT